MPNTEPLLTAGDVARLLSVHEETVRRWTREGKMPAVKLPNKTVRYRQADVEAMREPAPVIEATA